MPPVYPVALPTDENALEAFARTPDLAAKKDRQRWPHTSKGKEGEGRVRAPRRTLVEILWSFGCPCLVRGHPYIIHHLARHVDPLAFALGCGCRIRRGRRRRRIGVGLTGRRSRIDDLRGCRVRIDIDGRGWCIPGAGYGSSYKNASRENSRTPPAPPCVACRRSGECYCQKDYGNDCDSFAPHRHLPISSPIVAADRALLPCLWRRSLLGPPGSLLVVVS